MERVLVGLMTVTLVVGEAGPGRTDYILICSLGGPGNGQFPISQGLTADPAENVFVVEAWHRQIEAFSCSRPFFTTFGDPGSSDGESFEPTPASLPTLSNPLAGAGLKPRNRHVPTSSPSLADFPITGMAELLFPYCADRAALLPETTFVADTIVDGGPNAAGDLSVLARFGGLGLQPTQASEPPPGVVVGPPEDAAAGQVFNVRLILSLSLLALGLLGALGYAWRQRRRRLRRLLRGPRRTALYRSPRLPNPPGRTR